MINDINKNIEDLKSIDKYVRDKAFNLIRTYRNTEYIELLKKLLNHPLLDTQLKSIMLLGEIDGKRAKADLLALLDIEENDEYTTATIISTLGTLKDNSLKPVFERFLKSTDLRVKANTIDALGKLDCDENLIKILRPFLEHSNNRVRANAALALWHWGEEDAVGVLKVMLEDSNKWVQDSAKYALKRLGVDELGENLKALLNMDNITEAEEGVKRDALLSLGLLFSRKFM